MEDGLWLKKSQEVPQSNCYEKFSSISKSKDIKEKKSKLFKNLKSVTIGTEKKASSMLSFRRLRHFLGFFSRARLSRRSFYRQLHSFFLWEIEKFFF